MRYNGNRKEKFQKHMHFWLTGKHLACAYIKMNSVETTRAKIVCSTEDFVNPFSTGKIEKLNF